MSKYRVGMIGAGWVTGHHLPGWQAIADRARIVAICDPDIDAARTRARQFGIEAVFTSAAEMLEATALDAVDICSPRETHADMVRLAAAKGLAILCQKPLAPTLGEAEALIAELAPSVRLMVHENWRFRAYYRRLAEWLVGGAIGRVRVAALEFLSSGMIADADGNRPALIRQPFFATLDRLIVSEVLIHHLDTLRFLLGPLQVDAATLERSTTAVKGEDVATLSLSRVEDGAPVGILASMAAHGAPPAPRDYLRLFGERGTITLDGTALTLEGPEPRSETFDADKTYNGSYAAAIAHFIARLEDGEPFETAPVDNIETLKLVERCYQLGGFQTGGKKC